MNLQTYLKFIANDSSDLETSIFLEYSLYQALSSELKRVLSHPENANKSIDLSSINQIFDDTVEVLAKQNNKT